MEIKVLDHGYVRVERVMGDDQFLAECARMSTDTVATKEANQRLVDRLIRDRHTSPIEFGQIVVEVAMPIFVMRQWVRHRTGAFNEFSGRYSEFPDIFYVPELERMQGQSTFNKQGSAGMLEHAKAVAGRKLITAISKRAFWAYEKLLSLGLTRELARIVLPVNFYTKVRWTVNLHNLFHFLKLREDQHAQWEVQQFANAMHEVARAHFPAAVAAYEHHVENTYSVSDLLATTLATIAKGQIPSEYVANNPELRDFLARHASPDGAIDV